MKKIQQNIISDIELIEMIQSGGNSRMRAIDMIYSNNDLKEKIQMHVIKRGGDRHEAQDVFHDGIIALDRSLRQGMFQMQTSIDGFLFSICRNVWRNKWRKKSKTSSNELPEIEEEEQYETDQLLFSEEKKKQLNKVLQLMDTKCQKILQLWQDSWSMEEIADACNLSSKNMAKKYRYRCMKKLVNKLNSNKNLLETLRHV